MQRMREKVRYVNKMSTQIRGRIKSEKLINMRVFFNTTWDSVGDETSSPFVTFLFLTTVQTQNSKLQKEDNRYHC